MTWQTCDSCWLAWLRPAKVLPHLVPRFHFCRTWRWALAKQPLSRLIKHSWGSRRTGKKGSQGFGSTKKAQTCWGLFRAPLERTVTKHDNLFNELKVQAEGKQGVSTIGSSGIGWWFTRVWVPNPFQFLLVQPQSRWKQHVFFCTCQTVPPDISADYWSHHHPAPAKNMQIKRNWSQPLETSAPWNMGSGG